MEWALLTPLIEEIRDLKEKRNAIVLGHNYMTPDIFYGVSDLTGDSLQLARQAAETDAEVIVLAGVHFMAETAKIANPNKIVLIPDLDAGCSLAESITAEDVRRLKRAHPGVPVVTYVNTSSAVKAESDICCTSSNALQVVNSLNTDRVIFIPDKYLADWVASQTDVEVITWEGACMVHERFTGEQMRGWRKRFSASGSGNGGRSGNGNGTGISIVAHPECPPDVLAEADFVGSTSGMIAWVDENRPQRVALITECSMSDNVAIEFPEVEFVRPCNLCPHMKKITLEKIRRSLAEMKHEVVVEAAVAAGARRAVERMLAVGATASS